jgi:hypothetical protein
MPGGVPPAPKPLTHPAKTLAPLHWCRGLSLWPPLGETGSASFVRGTGVVRSRPGPVTEGSATPDAARSGPRVHQNSENGIVWPAVILHPGDRNLDRAGQEGRRRGLTPDPKAAMASQWRRQPDEARAIHEIQKPRWQASGVGRLMRFARSVRPAPRSVPASRRLGLDWPPWLSITPAT